MPITNELKSLSGNNAKIDPCQLYCRRDISEKFIHVIKGIDNVSAIPHQKLTFPASTPAVGKNRHDESPAETARINELYKCAIELKNNIDCLLAGNSQKYLRIGGHKESVPTIKIKLPSGRVAYAGYFQDRLLVSDGEIYHLETIVMHRPMGVTAALSCLLANLTHVYTAYAAQLPPTGTEPPSPVARHTTQHGGHQPLAGLWHGAQRVISGMHGWLSGLSDPLRLPRAAAQTITTPTTDPIYIAHAEFVIKLGPAGPTESTDTQAERSISGLADHMAMTAAITTPVTTKPNAVADEPWLHPPRSVSAMKYRIEHHDRKIFIPNKDAKALIQIFEDKFFLANSNVTDALDILLSFDKFIGKEIVEIFHRGLYLKENSYAFDLIILKKQQESIIDYYRLTLIDSSMLYKIYNYLKSQIKTGDYLIHIYRLLAEAHQAVDSDIIIEAVETSNHISFETAKENVIEKIKQEKTHKKAHLNRILKSINILQQAHEEYCLHLTTEEDKTIDRVVYLNSKEIYKSIIYGNKHALIDNLIKLKYYFIFEYTRINGISVYSRYNILPGELSQYGRIFDEQEQELTYEELDTEFTNEIFSFINREEQNHHNLDHLNGIIELTRRNEMHLDALTNWKEKNIKPLKKVYQLLSNIIKTDRIEKLKFSQHNEWYRDFEKSINKTKKILAMLVYIQELQEIFNGSLDYYNKNNLNIRAESGIQFIIAAKIAAMKSYLPNDNNSAEDYFYLQMYEKEINAGNLELLARSAAFWFLSQERNNNEKVLINQNFIHIVRNFITIQNFFSFELKSRTQRDFTSVYKLSPSDEKQSLEDYYQQFTEYKLHDSFSEAQEITVKSSFNSNLNLLDLFYAPQSIFTFKVFSRNYVHNTLTPGNSVYSPADNIGYLSIFKSKSGKLIMLSTLISFTFFKDISELQQHSFISRLIDGWQKKGPYRDSGQNQHIPASGDDLLMLFSAREQNNDEFIDLRDIILKKPKEEITHQPAPAYTLMAVEHKDILSVIRPYIVHVNEEGIVNNPKMALMTIIDYLNQATLIAIADKLKVTLRNYSWLEYITHFIPFFKALCHHWHDAEHKLVFHEVMFDLFDLTMMLISVGAGVRKISDITFKSIINKAIDQRIPPKMIKRFIINELITASPEIGRQSTSLAAKELLSFFNPVTSMPLTSSLFDKLRSRVFQNIKGRITFGNDASRQQMTQKLAIRKEWRAEVDHLQLSMTDEGIYVDQPDTGAARYYIKDQSDYFEVIKNPGENHWRIINSQTASDNNFAIPVVRTHTGKWVSIGHFRSDRRHSSISFYNLNREEFSGLDVIKFESIPTFDHVAEDFDESIAFNKRILRFFLYQNTFVRDLIKGEAKHEDFLDRFYGTFFFSKEILALLRYNPNSYDAKFVVKAMEAINAKHDGIVRFRAIISWRDENDLQPEIHFALRIDIDDKIFVIDLFEMRPHLQPQYKNDVFTQSEWLMTYGIDAANGFELIKYKDFELITDAKSFQIQEAISPRYYIQDGFLLKEPFWYRSLLMGGLPFLYQTPKSIKYPFDANLLSSMRSLRFNRKLALTMEEYPLHVLYQCGKLTEENLAKTMKLIQAAQQHVIKHSDLFSFKRQISSLEELLKINEGKLLAFYGPSERLEHLLLSLGHGRFTGFGNSFFDPAFPDRVSLIIAEHLGKFADDELKLRFTGYGLKVIAGTAHGVVDNTPVFMEDFLSGTNPPARQTDQTPPQSMSREQILLGDKCWISLIQDSQKRLDITLSGAPFMVNNLDTVEFSDILRGLGYLENLDFNLAELELIVLHTCFGGYGDHYSMAQILADQFNIPVQLYPSFVEPEIKSRRPEWFKIYQPLLTRFTPAQRAAIHASDNPQLRQAQQTHRQLHDLMLVVGSVVDPQALLHQKRIYQYIPPIYINIAKILIPKEKYAPLNIKPLGLGPESIAMFYQICSEYDLSAGTSHHVVEQAFLDIILSIDELQYLSNWFNAHGA